MSSCQNKIPIIGNLLIRATGDMLANFDERQLSISVQTRERWHCTCVFVVNCITAFLKFSLVSVFPIIMEYILLNENICLSAFCFHLHIFIH